MVLRLILTAKRTLFAQVKGTDKRMSKIRFACSIMSGNKGKVIHGQSLRRFLNS